MAPSPTGFLHLGTLRTALFGYLLAKKWQGDFILRIEDTDQKREVEGAADALISMFERLDITFNEGPHIGGSYGPYVQTERREIYAAHANQLIESGKAYYCFCTPERLETMRAEQTARKEPPRYDRHCRSLPKEEAKRRAASGEAHVIRHALPLEGSLTVHDELRGDITFNLADLDDYVLLKSDGLPTYHLASVIDDHLMEISHVTRGDEWIPSLPKNISLYGSFGWTPPKFIHLPLILNKAGGKLSKRQGDVFVEQYLEKGYLKEALINFCALLGWRPEGDHEIFTLKELETVFDISGMGTSPAVFDEDKLDYLNGIFIRRLTLGELADAAQPFLAEIMASAPSRKKDRAFIQSVLALEQPRLKRLSELSENTSYFFTGSLEYDPALLSWKNMPKETVASNLAFISAALSEIKENDWTNEKLSERIVARLKTEGKALGDYLWPLRASLSGRKASPGPFEIASILGKEETLDKIAQAIGKLS